MSGLSHFSELLPALGLDESIMIAEADKSRTWKVRLAAYVQMRWLRILILLGAGFLVRTPSLQGQLIWDDQLLVRDNPFIKSPLLIFEAFRHYLFPDGFSPHYRPVQNISYFFDYWFWNEDTYGFHLTNILLHVGSGLLLYLLLRRLLSALLKSTPDKDFAPEFCAYLVALAWVVHPVHSAAVDYISGRADSLAFVFACGGWLLVLRARETSVPPLRYLLYVGASVAGLLALCSREIAFIWVALFLLYLFCFEKAVPRRAKFISTGCCLLVAATYIGLRHLPEHRGGNPAPSYTTASMRATLMLRALGDYGRLMIVPANLHMERTVIEPDNYKSVETWRRSAAAEYLSLAGLVTLAVLLCGSIRRGGAQPIRVLGAGWFILGYLPISNLVELNATVAEHWLYLPSVGLLIFLVGCALELPPRYRGLCAGAAALAIFGFSWQSTLRSRDWVTEETFYQRTFAQGGTSTRVAVNLGRVFANRGDYVKSEAIFRNVLSIVPDYPLARTSLAEVLYRQGKKVEAEAIYQATNAAAAEARKEYPRTWIAATNLARLRHDEKNDASALAILEETRAAYPREWEIIRFESEILRQAQGPEKAQQLIEQFASANWWHYEAAIASGKLHAEEGKTEEALSDLRHASRLDVHDAKALNLIATIDLHQNKLAEAFAAQHRAVARQPDQPHQYAMLSDILGKMGRVEEARAATAQVARLTALAQTKVITQ